MRITQRLDSRSSHRRNEETPDNAPVFSRERTSSRRKRFIQECARSTIHRRALPTSLPLDRLSLFPAWTNVGRKAEFAQDGTHLLVVIPLRQTHPLPMLFAWLRTLDDDAFDRWAHELHVMTLRSLNRHADRHSMPFSEQVAFHSTLAPKSRDWGRLFPHPMELWSMPHPYSASPSRARTAHQTARLLLARV